ncbi:MAG: hypothetical protein HYV07_26395 [Deltaproteobacteria bacterium]|nr:hypothetical protein [Deltaproteobacteria bacterium]
MKQRVVFGGTHPGWADAATPTFTAGKSVAAQLAGGVSWQSSRFPTVPTGSLRMLRVDRGNRAGDYELSFVSLWPGPTLIHRWSFAP